MALFYPHYIFWDSSPYESSTETSCFVADLQFQKGPRLGTCRPNQHVMQVNSILAMDSNNLKYRMEMDGNTMRHSSLVILFLGFNFPKIMWPKIGPLTQAKNCECCQARIDKT